MRRAFERTQEPAPVLRRVAPERDAYTVEEAAERLSLSPNAVRGLVRDGHLRVTHLVGLRGTRIRRAEIERYLNECDNATA